MLQDWEHIVDTQGFPPCWTTPNRMSFWEETKAKNKLMHWCITWKMKPNTFEYACRVILPIKKDGRFRFYKY